MKANGLNEKLIKLLIEKGLTISTAESCTGGLLSAYLTEVHGASEALNECIVTYSNAAKERELNVKRETLEKYGAVSRRTAEEMARGICLHTGADIGVGITGVAGPTGGTDKKPVGTVFIGICVNGAVSVYENHFAGSRSEVRESACEFALKKTAELVLTVQ